MCHTVFANTLCYQCATCPILFAAAAAAAAALSACSHPALPSKQGAPSLPAMRGLQELPSSWWHFNVFVSGMWCVWGMCSVLPPMVQGV